MAPLTPGVGYGCDRGEPDAATQEAVTRSDREAGNAVAHRAGG